MGRARKRANQTLEDNMYKNSAGYYRWRNPETGKYHGLGKDLAKATKHARVLNAKLVGDVSYVARVMGSQMKTVSEVIDEYLIGELPHMPLDDSTRSNYTFKLRRYKREFGDKAMYSVDRVFVGKWLANATKDMSNDAYMKHRERLVDLWDWAVSRGYAEANEPAMTRKRSLSKKLAKNHKKRQRLTVEQFWDIHKNAPPWLQCAMELSLVTLQGRQEIATMKYEDIRDGHIYVIREKTSGDSNMAFIRIKLTDQIKEIIERTKADGLLSPYVVHYSPTTRRRDLMNAKGHWTRVMPQYLSKAFKKARDACGQFDGWEPRTRPTFHEIRSLGGRIYENLGYPKSYIKSLMTHTDEKTTDIYLTKGEQALTDDNFIAVQADMALGSLPRL